VRGLSLSPSTEKKKKNNNKKRKKREVINEETFSELKGLFTRLEEAANMQENGWK
jgi:hypothetical protein